MARLCIFLLALLLSLAARAESAQLLMVAGPVQNLQADPAQALQAGATLAGAFRLRTGADGVAQIALEDGAVLTVLPGSEVSASAAPRRQLQLHSGGLSLLTAKDTVNVLALGYVLKANGFMRLRQCGPGCPDVAGLYGRALDGEVVVEYAGGRSVLRNKPFRASAGGVRPLILAREPEWFAEDTQLQAATRAKQALAEDVRAAMQAYQAGEFEPARLRLLGVLEQSPTEKIVPYYLGLIALEQKDNAAALAYLQQYSREDPDKARERGVGQLVTLLLTNQLQGEVALALQQESRLGADKPEPNSIAVQAFSNRGDPAYAALAKGIAAMVISDLSKVPGLKVLERQKVQKLVDEIQLGESGLVSQDSAVKAGRLMRAEKVLVGSFGVQ
jgi:Curli production assembly/transport component CsgG/FecR protein